MCCMSLIELYIASVTIYIFSMCMTETQRLNRKKTRAGPGSYGWGGVLLLLVGVELEKDRRTYRTCECSHCFHPLTKCHNLKHQNFNFNYKLFHVLTCCIIVLFPFKESTSCQCLTDKLSAEYFLCCMFRRTVLTLRLLWRRFPFCELLFFNLLSAC